MGLRAVSIHAALKGGLSLVSTVATLAAVGIAPVVCQAAPESFVYTICRDQQYLTRYRSSDGATVWQVKSTYTPGGGEPLLLTHLAAWREHAYVAYGSRYLGQLRASDGSRAWTADAALPGEDAAAPIAEICASDHSVFVLHQGKPFISSHSDKDGALKWRRPSGLAQDGKPELPPLHISVAGPDLYAVYADNHLARLRASDGKRVWLATAGGLAEQETYSVTGIAAGADGCYVIHKDQPTVSKFRAKDGTLAWRTGTPYTDATQDVPVSIAASGRDVVVTCASGKLAMLRASDGTTVWVVPTAPPNSQ